MSMLQPLILAPQVLTDEPLDTLDLINRFETQAPCCIFRSLKKTVVT